jgi:RHS repeat-associated protein
MLTQHHDFFWSPYGLLWSSTPNTVYTPGFGQRSNGINGFYQVDWLGSTRYVTDITGTSVLAAQSCDAWGHRDAQATGSPKHPTDVQFAGGEGYQTGYADASTNEPGVGLQYLQQRYYDPAIGRFISRDPAGFAGALSLYPYVDNDPVNGVDPWGLQTFPRDPTEESSPGATVKALVEQRQWQQLREYLSDIIGTVRNDSTLQRILRPLRGSLRSEFEPILKRYPFSAYKCSDATAALQGVVDEREIPYTLIRLEETGGPRLVRPFTWLEKLRWWRGAPAYTQNGYHAAIEVYGRVYDTVTGAKGLPYAQWLERLGITARDIAGTTNVTPGTFTQ